MSVNKISRRPKEMDSSIERDNGKVSPPVGHPFGQQFIYPLATAGPFDAEPVIIL
jgi:hypothetical protein